MTFTTQQLFGYIMLAAGMGYVIGYIFGDLIDPGTS